VPDRPFTKVPDELLEALAKCGASAAVFRLMVAILRETYGYGEPIRKIRRKRLGEIMGVKERRVRQIIEQAKDLNMVAVEGWSVSVQEDHGQWPKPAEPPAAFRNRQRGTAGLAETGSVPVPHSKPAAHGCRVERQRGTAAQRHRQETSTSTSTPSEEPDTGLFAADDLEEPVEKPKREDQILSERLWAAFGQDGEVATGVFTAVNQWIAQGIDDPPLYDYVDRMEERQPRINGKSKPDVAIPATIRKDLRYPPRWRVQDGRQPSSTPKMLQQGSSTNLDEMDPDMWSFRPSKGQTGR